MHEGDGDETELVVNVEFEAGREQRLKRRARQGVGEHQTRIEVGGNRKRMALEAMEHAYILARAGRFGLTMGVNMNPNLLLCGALVGATVCLPCVAHAQRSFPRIGADIGYSYLLDSKTRATFGSGVTDIGVGFGNITPTIDGRVGLDLSILRPSEDRFGVNSDALVISAGPEYRKIFIPGSVRSQIPQGQSQPNPDSAPPGTPRPTGSYGPPPVLPYYGASVNLVYAQVDAPLAGRDGNGFGVGGSVFAGLTFNNRFYLEARVRAESAVESFNFSRAGVTAGIRF